MNVDVKIVKEFTTGVSHNKVGENGVIYAQIVPYMDDIEVSKEHVALFKQHLGDQLPMKLVIDTRQLKRAKKEVRDYFGDPSMADVFGPAAFIVGSGLSRITVNLLLKFTKPVFPCKAFTNEKKAMEWLENYQS